MSYADVTFSIHPLVLKAIVTYWYETFFNKKVVEPKGLALKTQTLL